MRALAARKHLDDLFDEHAHSVHGPLVSIGGSLSATLDVYAIVYITIDDRMRGRTTRRRPGSAIGILEATKAVAELVARTPDACSTQNERLYGDGWLVKRGQCPLATKALLAQRAGLLVL